MGPRAGFDLICLSHLRWNFVFQRPQHLLTRCARERRVFYIEEPLFDSDIPRLETSRDPSGVVIAVPRLPAGLPENRIVHELRALVNGLIAFERIRSYVLWYYTPMALAFTDHLRPDVVVYDCMDELSGFAGAPAGLRGAERELLRSADLVLTGGASLFEAKRELHPNVHAFPSSVDVPHFARARTMTEEPDDQSPIPRPRLGFFGVIDERLDVALLLAVAQQRPDWHMVIVGPLAKIDPATLPRPANIHYLGPKPYSCLPEYIGGWDVALLPFARNDATRFISPTKTPEYLAAGKPVVSTSIRDVIRPYGELGLVRIADTPELFIDAVEAALADDDVRRCAVADALLARSSWDSTWASMSRLVDAVRRQPVASDANSTAERAVATPILTASARGDSRG